MTYCWPWPLYQPEQATDFAAMSDQCDLAHVHEWVHHIIVRRHVEQSTYTSTVWLDYICIYLLHGVSDLKCSCFCWCMSCFTQHFLMRISLPTQNPDDIFSSRKFGRRAAPVHGCHCRSWLQATLNGWWVDRRPTKDTPNAVIDPRCSVWLLNVLICGYGLILSVNNGE